MPLEFTNVVKGMLTQTMVMALLERGGYRVTRLGIEELFAEVKHLDLQRYLRLGLPMQLRHLPDLLVAELDMSNVFLVEVKYRRRFDENAVDSLYKDMKEQYQHWPQTVTVIMISESFEGNRKFHQDHVRVMEPDQVEILANSKIPLEKRWESLHHLQRVFLSFNNDKYIYDVQKSADTLTQTLKDLGKL